jgi:uncharacterized protein
MRFILFIYFSLLFSALEPYYEYWANDSLKLMGSFTSNKKHGKWEYYNLKGKVWKYIIYENGKKIDEMKWQLFKPKLSEISLMENSINQVNVNQILDSSKIKVQDSTKIEIHNPLLKGYTGNWIEYYDSGELECVIEYMNGLKHGKANYYNENKKLIRTERYLSGKKHGKWIWYWSNKKVKEMGYYNSGRKQGKWIKFDENGNEILVKNFY